MATTGHENEAINVQGLKASLQKFKTDKVDGKSDKSATVSTVAYDGTKKKITKTINGTTSDVVSIATLKSDMSLGSAADKNVPSSGNASSSQVVMGNDTRLSDSRTANGGNSDTVDGYHITVVSSMPASPDTNTIYIVK